MDTFIRGTLETVGCDLGRFLYQLDQEMEDTAIVNAAMMFLRTFDTCINVEHVAETNVFLISVARGYERIQHE